MSPCLTAASAELVQFGDFVHHSAFVLIHIDPNVKPKPSVGLLKTSTQEPSPFLGRGDRLGDRSGSRPQGAALKPGKFHLDTDTAQGRPLGPARPSSLVPLPFPLRPSPVRPSTSKSLSLLCTSSSHPVPKWSQGQAFLSKVKVLCRTKALLLNKLYPREGS